MRQILIWPIFIIIFISGCIFSPNEVSITLKGKKLQKATGDNLSSATVSNVQIINNQLVITGNNLSNVTNVNVKKIKYLFLTNLIFFIFN